MGSIDLQKKAIAKLEMTLAQTSLFEVTDLWKTAGHTWAHCSPWARTLSQEESTRGGEQADLRKLQQNTFLRLRMNALALKHRLRDWLHQRKFEIEKLERSHRHSVNGIYRWWYVIILIWLTSHNVADSNSMSMSHHRWNIKNQHYQVGKESQWSLPPDARSHPSQQGTTRCHCP